MWGLVAILLNPAVAADLMSFGQLAVICAGVAVLYWLVGWWSTYSSGWRDLAQVYRSNALFFSGARWTFQWAAMRGNSRPFANRSPLRLDVLANSDGLRLEVSLFFLPWFSLAPPLFVPWPEISAGYVFMKHVSWDVVELTFARAPAIPFRIKEVLAIRIAEQVGSTFRWRPPHAAAKPERAQSARAPLPAAAPEPAGPARARAATMRCPKCGLEQGRSPECVGCHVLVAKYVPGGPRGAFRDAIVRTQFGRQLAALTPHTWATWTLVAANVLVFALMLARGADPLSPTIGQLIASGANYGPLATAGEWWRLLSSMFVHVGAVHLLFNMIVLAYVGVIVERLTGSAGMLTVYLISGLLGSETSVFWNPTVVSAGASGAVFGLQGAVLGVLVRSRSSIPSAVLKPLVRSMLVLLAFNLLYSLGHAGIDTAAHVGGLAGGLACGLAVGASLTDKGMARRPRRDFLLAAGGFAFVLLGAARLPLAFDVLGEATALARADGTATQAYEAGLRAWRGGRLTDEGLASLVETHVLTDWAAYRRHVDGLLAGPPRVGGDRLRIVSDYLALRQRAWEQLVRALRGGDAAGIEDAIRTLQRTRAMAP